MPVARLRLALVALALLLPLLAGCGNGGRADADGFDSTLRLGYFPNVTHAPAIVGDRQGFFRAALNPSIALDTYSFNTGSEAVEALFGDRLDVAFLGPNPTINAFAQSQGQAVRIVAGATTGGASLVVREGIDDASDLVGARIATPGLGNTQDVALRAWLAGQGLRSDLTGGGEVSILPQANADTLTRFLDGDIDGAWVPEPWATRMLQREGASVLVDESELWDDGRFVTTHVVVRTRYLDQHPEAVAQFLEGVVDAVEFLHTSPGAAQRLVDDGIHAITGNRLDPEVLRSSWTQLDFTWDPVPASLVEAKDHAVSVGLLEPTDLSGIYALEHLNAVLARRGHEQVSAP